MLVISTKEAGIIRIGEATLYVREIRGNQVRVSITAPEHVKIEHLEPVPRLEAAPEVVVRRSGRR